MSSDQFVRFATGRATSTKPLAICADDYGVDPQVDTAIVELAGQGRLQATSVLVDAGIDDASAARVSSLDIDLGLHLNFTDALGDLTADDVMPLKPLIVRSHARQLSKQWVRDCVERQLARFEARFRRCPDYVDGHLHVHQLPLIREQLMASLSTRRLPEGFWIRDTRAADLSTSSASERAKSWVVGHLGMSHLAKLAGKQGLRHNHGFFGVYDFTGAHRPFMQMMQGWLDAAQPGALVMTHPATGVLVNDPIGQSRVREYEVLASPAFGQLLDAQGVRLARLSQVLSSLP